MTEVKVLATGPVVPADGPTDAWRTVLVEHTNDNECSWVVYAEYQVGTPDSYYSHAVYCDTLEEGLKFFQQGVARDIKAIQKRSCLQPCTPFQPGKNNLPGWDGEPWEYCQSNNS